MRFLQGWGRVPKVAGALSMALLAAGCGNVTQLRVDDGSAPIGSLRAVHRFSGGPGGGGLEFDFQGVRGESNQGLDTFESATLGGQTLQGPAQLHHRAEAVHAQLSYNHRLFVGSPVEFEWFAGVALHRLRWTTTGGTAPPGGLNFARTWYGPAGGVGTRFVLGPKAALELRFSAAVEFDNVDGSRSSAEAAFAFSPVPDLQLRVGIADSRSSYEPVSLSSDLRLRTRGPFLGLAFAF